MIAKGPTLLKHIYLAVSMFFAGFHGQALYDKELANVYIYSLGVSGTTLLVPKFGQEKLIIYQLEMSEE